MGCLRFSTVSCRRSARFSGRSWRGRKKQRISTPHQSQKKGDMGKLLISEPDRVLARHRPRNDNSGSKARTDRCTLFVSFPTREWPCWPKHWTSKCSAVPRPLCPVRCGRSWPCSAPRPASTLLPARNGSRSKFSQLELHLRRAGLIGAKHSTRLATKQINTRQDRGKRPSFPLRYMCAVAS